MCVSFFGTPPNQAILFVIICKRIYPILFRFFDNHWHRLIEVVLPGDAPNRGSSLRTLACGPDQMSLVAATQAYAQCSRAR